MAERVVVILGPTASGKTALGTMLAQQHNGAVISADSRQVYAGFNIGTAKPPEAWQREPHDTITPDVVDGTPHYLLNIAAPSGRLTLAEWQKAAYHCIEQVVTKHQLPIIVGGTMLYVESILNNYQLPEVPPRESLRAALEAEPTDSLYEQLTVKDPKAREFIEPGNKRRIIRALEVIAATGQPFSRTRQRGEPRYDFYVIGLFPGWETLQKNVTDRAQGMLDQGLLKETLSLRAQYGPDLPLLKTMNYAQAPDLPKVIQANMRYAHRQMSWWRKHQEITWFTAASDAATPDLHLDSPSPSTPA